MVYFQCRNPYLGNFWRALEWKSLEFSMAIWNTPIWYILMPFGSLVIIWYILFRFGIGCQEKSGNPGFNGCLEGP
jgi:hypothetical protein